jgi:hypothetical protein
MSETKLLIALGGALVLAGLAPLTADDATWSGQASATIQATAYVSPAIGMAAAEFVNSDPIASIERYRPGSHLYWLYYPRPDGLQVQIVCEGDSLVDCGLTDSESSAPGLQVLTRFRYASLVDFGSVEGADAEDAPLTVTMIYTDN